MIRCLPAPFALLVLVLQPSLVSGVLFDADDACLADDGEGCSVGLVQLRGEAKRSKDSVADGMSATSATVPSSSCLDSPAPIGGNPATCGSRADWLMNNRGQSASDAYCTIKLEEEPVNCACLPCDTGGVPVACSSATAPIPSDPSATCGGRAHWLVQQQGYSTHDAYCKVRKETPLCACLPCPTSLSGPAPGPSPSPVPPPAGSPGCEACSNCHGRPCNCDTQFGSPWCVCSPLASGWISPSQCLASAGW
jgi:hypothetical protein